MGKMMKASAIILSFLLSIGMIACNPSSGTSQEDAKIEAKEYIGEKNVGENTVKIYGNNQDANYKTVSFEETENLCADNEGMGWAILEEPLYGGLPSLGYKGVFPEVKTISLSTGWSVFEQTPGNYDWSVMDETIEYWVNQGKTINLRLCTDGLVLNQGVINGCPAWLFEEPYNVPKVVNSGDIYADLSSVVYQQELRKFLAEFSGHYSSENYPYRNAIEVVELRGYGMVGEWHSGWNTYNTIEERTAALCDTIDAWREAWGDTLLVISCTYEFLNNMWGVNNAQNYEDFMYYMGYDHVLHLDNISFRRDGIAFALQEYDSRMALDYFYLNTGLPLLGEIGDGYAKHGDDAAYPLFEAMNEALHKWRVNYQTVIGWVAQDFNVVIQQEPELVEYFNRLMGYRLVPDTVQYSSQVKAGDKMYVNTLWSNQAMGRCWQDYDFSVYFENNEGKTIFSATDSSFNPVSINGGEPHFFNFSYTLPQNLSKGKYTVKFAVSDKNGNPKMELPIAGNDGNNKYYLGEVSVGDTAAKDLSKVDPIDGTEQYTVVAEGKMTDRLTTVDGTKALVGSGNDAFAYGQTLEKGKTYYVSFDYRTGKAKEDICITDDSRYVVGAYCKKTGTWADTYEWLDVSNEVSCRSVTLKIPVDNNEYVLAFACKNNAAEIAVDNISVNSAKEISATFRINSDYTEKKADGTYEIISSITQNWADGLQLKERLIPHTEYMLTFDAATIAEISGGGFFYVRFTDPEVDEDVKKDYVASFSENRIGSFWTPMDRGYQKYSYIFDTSDYVDGWQLVFGVRNMGGVSIKNITLTALASDYAYTADAKEIQHNVIPNKNIDVDKNGVVENFEAGVFNGGCMFPGDHTTGIIHKNTNVISGNYSCYVENTNPFSSSYEFNVFCQTNLGDMTFSSNTTYKVRFKFMILENIKPEENGYFYCLARENGSFVHDTGVFEWREGYEVGEVYSVEYEFTTGNASNYYFMWGIHKYGSLVIDDVTFTKVENPSSANKTPKVVKGHAYEITQDVLYRN